jgi:hypothetical protein
MSLKYSKAWPIIYISCTAGDISGLSYGAKGKVRKKDKVFYERSFTNFKALIEKALKEARRSHRPTVILEKLGDFDIETEGLFIRRSEAWLRRAVKELGIHDRIHFSVNLDTFWEHFHGSDWEIALKIK